MRKAKLLEIFTYALYAHGGNQSAIDFYNLIISKILYKESMINFLKKIIISFMDSLTKLIKRLKKFQQIRPRLNCFKKLISII